MELVIQPFESLPNRQEIEIVERKGLGHPDTLCDAIAERICVRLCRWYLDRCATVLHHNVDKVLLCAGASRPSFGGHTSTLIDSLQHTFPNFGDFHQSPS